MKKWLKGWTEVPPKLSYSLAVIFVMFALGIRLGLDRLAPGIVPFATIFPAELAATFVGGIGPGLVATGLGGLSIWYLLLEPRMGLDALSAGDAVSLVLFLLSSLVIVATAAALRRALFRVRAAREEAAAAHSFAAEIMASITDPFYVVDGEWRFTQVNDAFEKLSGRGRDELIGRIVWDVFPQARGGAAYEANLRARREGKPVTFETVSQVLGRWIESTVFPGRFGVAVYVRDITQRKEAEERRKLLAAELAHRSRNLLAVVQAIAARSLSGDRTLEEARDVLLSRLEALAHAHSILTAQEWRHANLRAVLKAELEPYGYVCGRGRGATLGAPA